MPRYHVEIVEMVKEVRVYEVAAPDLLAAAGKAHKLWVGQGCKPKQPVQQEVDVREFVVREIESADDIVMEYEESALLELLAERAAALRLASPQVPRPSVLQLATFHLPSATPDFGPLLYVDIPDGWLVWPGDPSKIEAFDSSAWWWPINAFAFANNCAIIEFDVWHDVDEQFTKWDW